MIMDAVDDGQVDDEPDDDAYDSCGAPHGDSCGAPHGDSRGAAHGDSRDDAEAASADAVAG